MKPIGYYTDKHGTHPIWEIPEVTAGSILTLLKTVDGAGSELDADKLDGKEGSEFANSSHDHEILDVSDLQTALDGKLGATGTAFDSQKLDGKDSTEFLLVGAKAVDSDKVDGIHGGSFLRSDASDDFSGSLNYTPNTGVILKLDGKTLLQRHTANGGVSFGADDVLTIGCGEARNTMVVNLSESAEVLNLGSDNQVDLYTNLQSGWASGKKYTFNNGELTINGSKAWHEGNGGSGSNLDAGLLEGKTKAQIVAEAVGSSGGIPVGFVYMQLPGQSTPATLFGGTWSNISSSYADRTIRVEGATAETFSTTATDGSNQGHMLQSHHHYFWLGEGGGDNRSRGSSDNTNWTNSSPSTSGVAGATAGSETRMMNFTVRVWKRTA